MTTTRYLIGLTISPWLAMPAAYATPQFASATFAGGCFWCMEPPFDKLDGVTSTTSGYTGGELDSPSYAQVTAGGTGHADAVRIFYVPEKISYAELLDVFWHNVDPIRADGQFCDGGTQYRSAVFYHDDAQRRIAEASRDAINGSKTFPESVVTEIVKAGKFHPAETYHQDYYRKNTLRYKY